MSPFEMVTLFLGSLIGSLILWRLSQILDRVHEIREYLNISINVYLDAELEKAVKGFNKRGDG